jgi:hypothetical protein
MADGLRKCGIGFCCIAASAWLPCAAGAGATRSPRLAKERGGDFFQLRGSDMAQTRGFFRNALDRMVEARMRQANHYVNGALLMLDDETLKANGYSRAELKKRSSGYYFY